MGLSNPGEKLHIPEIVNPEIFENFPVLHTERLVLRALQDADAENIFAMRSNPLVNRFIARPPMKTLQEAKELIERVSNTYKNKEGIGWAVTQKNKGTYMGSFGFRRIEHENLRAEVGGELHPDLWGKGIAQEALAEVLRFGLSVMKLHSIEAQVWPENRSAIALLENSGFVKEGHLRECMLFNGKFLDRAIYALLNSGREG